MSPARHSVAKADKPRRYVACPPPCRRMTGSLIEQRFRNTL
ncbi:hypothetical protein LI90_2045 [Carbonactinospora thermoautotrophica]|uniref:Uncharacterized protein n=1 Tax=Carbonactinospora thermoautotrophica TaxID=1469144 RepID=A0A132MT21_9ACTN|nr:hypothetical protein LI90_2045 [Carbonactinospora thermoautotrophica]